MPNRPSLFNFVDDHTNLRRYRNRTLLEITLTGDKPKKSEELPPNVERHLGL